MGFFYFFVDYVLRKPISLSTFFLIHPFYFILLWFDFTCLLHLIHLVQTHSSTSHPVSRSLATVESHHVFAGQLLFWSWSSHAEGSRSADVITSFVCTVLSWNRTEVPTLNFNGNNVASCRGVCLRHLSSSHGFSPCTGMLFPCCH